MLIAQNAEEQHIVDLDKRIEIAVGAEDYELAAKLKKEKEFRLKIKEAVDRGDYEQAAVIKKELNAFLSGEVAADSHNDEQEAPDMITIAELNLKVGGMGSEQFYYGFAKGDQIVMSKASDIIKREKW